MLLYQTTRGIILGMGTIGAEAQVTLSIHSINPPPQRFASFYFSFFCGLTSVSWGMIQTSSLVSFIDLFYILPDIVEFSYL